MTDTDNIVLEHLRAIRGAIDNLAERMDENTARLGHLERTVAQIAPQIADLNGRMDNFDRRLTRIEKRLGLIDA